MGRSTVVGAGLQIFISRRHGFSPISSPPTSIMAGADLRLDWLVITRAGERALEG
jgi:hypothetical protein